jgi:SP family myo-inositol transporter-like MFS transporter 13
MKPPVPLTTFSSRTVRRPEPFADRYGPANKITEITDRDSGTAQAGKNRYNRLLLLVAGLGGLLYGLDVGIIAGALPYLEATSGLNAGQLSFIVAAVLLGSVVSTLFAGMLADWMGRKLLMACGGVLFALSIPLIALAHGYGPLVFGRLLQGVSAGLIGVVVPLYLAECLGASSRGKGTGIFQWLLTLGIVAAAIIGWYFSLRVDEIKKLGDAARLFAFKDVAWRSIFWISLPPGILFVIGSLWVAESPRWLVRRGRTEAARAALLRSRTDQQAAEELKEMEAVVAAEKTGAAAGNRSKESLLQRRYVIPFVLACVILTCNQATGVNSIIGYNANLLIQGGLGDLQAHLGYVILTAINFLMTIVGIVLVDRKGRKFLLSLGSAGIIVSLVCAALLFNKSESRRVDCKDAVQALVTPDQKATVAFDESLQDKLLAGQGEAGAALGHKPATLIVIYSYGSFRASTTVARSDDPTAKRIEICRENCLPSNPVVAFFSNPFANLGTARMAPLKIENALITPVPSVRDGWLTAVCTFAFMAFFALGPGVCVWLALSELMPTRIRSNGMSIALLLNQAVATAIAAIFLPTVGKYGYRTMFFAFAAFTVIYFVTAVFFLPETKGKTLEEIEAHFDGKSAAGGSDAPSNQS